MTRKLNILYGIAVLALLAPPAAHAQVGGGMLEEAKRTLNEAISLDKAGKKEEAAKEFRRAITIHPQFATAYEKYSLFLYAQKKFKLGLAVMYKGLRAIPGRKEFHGYKAMHLFRLERIPEAHEAFKAAEKGPEIAERFEVQAVYAQCARAMADYRRVIRAVGLYLKHRPKALAPSDFIFQTQAAEAWLRLGKFKQAGKLLRLVRKKGPKRYKASLLLLVEYLLRRGHCKVAAKAYTILTRKRRPSSIDLLPNLVDAHQCLKQTKEAYELAGEYLKRREEVLKKLIAAPTRRDLFGEVVPNVKRLVLLRGDLGMQLKLYDEALQEYQTALKLYRGEPKIVYRVAQAFYVQKQYDQVLAILGPELRKAEPMPAMIMLSLRAAIRTKKKPTAIAHADRLLKLKPVRPEYYYYAGMAYSSAGKFQQAADLLEKGNVKEERVRWELVRVYNYLGLRWLRKDDAGKAIEKLKRALVHEPKHPAVNRNLAVLHLHEKEGEEALPYAMVALAAQSDDPILNQIVAQVQAYRGDHKKALEHFKVAKKNFKGSEEQRVQLDLEAALSEVEAGDSDAGLKILQQAQRTLRKDPKAREMLRRNIVRAHLSRGTLFLDRNNPQKAWRELIAANKAAKALPEKEAAVVRTMVALGALAAGKVSEAKKMIQQYQRVFIKVMNMPYNLIGYPLLMAYADTFSPVARQVQAAAGKIAKLAAKVPQPARGNLEKLAGAIYMQIAVKLYRAGQTGQARRPIAEAKRLAGRMTTEMRHNVAVLDYTAGSKAAALRVLEASAKRVPVALCNVAVHHEANGALQKAYEFFSQCSKRGTRGFPSLKPILEAKAAVFGKR